MIMKMHLRARAEGGGSSTLWCPGVVMMKQLSPGEVVTLFPVPLGDPDWEGELVDASPLLNMVRLAEEEAIHKHVVYELVRVRGIEPFPFERGEVPPDGRVWTKVHHIGERPLNGM